MSSILVEGTVYGPYKNSKGYLFVNIVCEGSRVTISYARYLLMKEGYDVQDKEIHHIDGNPLNNILTNLSIVEYTEHKNLHKKGRTFYNVICSWCIKQYRLEARRYNEGLKKKSNFCCSSSCKGKFMVSKKKH